MPCTPVLQITYMVGWNINEISTLYTDNIQNVTSKCIQSYN